MKPLCLLAIVLFASFLPQEILRAQFSTVINVPPDAAPNAIAGSTQLNLGPGGELPSGFEARIGSELNMSGGIVGKSFDAEAGSVVIISGGTLGTDFDAIAGSDVELIGGEFRLNGELYLPNTITLTDEDVLTGTLSDGSSFIFSPLAAEVFEGVTLTRTSLPAIDSSPIIVDQSSPPGPTGLRTGQSLTVRNGISLGKNFSVVAATLTLENGKVEDVLEVAEGVVNHHLGTVGRLFAFRGSEVNIKGGTVADESRAYVGSVINISGGSVGRRFNADPGSVVNISGGSIGSDLWATGSNVSISGGSVSSLDVRAGSELDITGGSVGSIDANIGSVIKLSNGSLGRLSSSGVVSISGGLLGRRFTANSGSEIDISGGTIGREFLVRNGSDVEFSGGEFQLNGLDFILPTITLMPQDVLTGTFADGTAFVFSPLSGDTLINVKLASVALPAIDTTPIIVGRGFPRASSSLREGQTLTLMTSGLLPDDFAAVDATINIQAGIVGNDFETAGTLVDIDGGSVGDNFEAHSESVINIRSGSIGANFKAHSGTTVSMSGGTVEENFTITADSVLNLSGGSVGDRFTASVGSEVHLFGSEFMLDGVRLDTLTHGKAVEITEREVTLSGLLADGSDFSFLLRTRFNTQTDIFSSGALLTVTLVPEPTSLMLLTALSGLLLFRVRVSLGWNERSLDLNQTSLL